MIAALWREFPINFLAEGAVVVTLAAVLHVDAKGGSQLLVSGFVEVGFHPRNG